MYAIDMQQEHLIRDVSIAFAAHGWATDYELLASVDGSQWSTLFQRNDGTSGQHLRIELDEPQMIRHIAVRAIKPDAAGQPGVQMAIAELAAWAIDLTAQEEEPEHAAELLASLSAGSAAGTSKVNAAPDAGNHLVIQLSAIELGDAPSRCRRPDRQQRYRSLCILEQISSK